MPRKKLDKRNVSIPQFLFDEITKHENLTRNEEIALAQAIEEGENAKTELLKEKGNSSLTTNRKTELFTIIAASQKAREKFVLANLRLVLSIAKKHLKRAFHSTLADLIQEGSKGLIRFVEEFDWRMGFKFSTKATWSIFNSINVLLRNLDSTTISLDDLLRNTKEGNLYEFMEDKRTALLDDTVDKNLIQYVVQEALLCELKPKEREIISLRFGLEDGVGRTLEKIADLKGESIEWVRQKLRKALNKLRRNKKISELLICLA